MTGSADVPAPQSGTHRKPPEPSLHQGSSPPKTPLSQRLGKSVVAVLAMAAPAILMGVLWHPQAVGPFVLGALVGVATVLPAGQRLGWGVTALLLLITPLAVVSGLVPVTGACLMALLCAASGITALWGLQGSLTLIPLIMAYFVIDPPSVTGEVVSRQSTAYLVSVMLLVAGGSLWTVIIVPVLARHRNIPPLEPTRRLDAVVYTVAITVLCSGSTLVVLIVQPGSQGAWLILTILAVSKLGLRTTMIRSVNRVIGTLVGALLAVGVVTVVDSAGIQALVGLVFVMLAMTARSGQRYWVYVMFLTPAVVLLASQGDTVMAGEYRVLYTAIGAGLVLLTTVMVLGYARLAADGHLPAPKATPAEVTPQLGEPDELSGQPAK